MDRWTVWHRKLWIETLDTVLGESDVSEVESEGEGQGEGDEGYLGDSEDMDEDDDEGEEDEDEEKLLADCPVAIHDVKPWNETETEDKTEDGGGSYVAFVGHLEDSRSMASLILGICDVEMDDSE